jgi:hypothetical protein
MGASNAAQQQFGPQMRGASTGVQQQERVTRAATTSIIYQMHHFVFLVFLFLYMLMMGNIFKGPVSTKHL